MDIIVVGSGIAGLTAAIGLRRAGHRIRIFERATTATAFGAGVVIGYNASRVLTAFGMDYEAANMDVAGPMKILKGDSLKEIRTFDSSDVENWERMSQSKQYFAHRVDLQEGLVRLATQRGTGIPVEIIYSASVISYSVESGTISLEDGSVYGADLIVAADGEFRFKCDRSSLRRELEGFHESIVALADKTSEILPLWKLPERPPLPTWRRGRLVVIGDAAHPMLPNQGQGAGMAVEDSGALSVLFSNMPRTDASTSARSISDRLSLFQRVRKGRASVVQLISHVPYFEDSVKIMYPQLLEQMPAENLPGADGNDQRHWYFSYNVLEDSRRVLDQYLESNSTNGEA